LRAAASVGSQQIAVIVTRDLAGSGGNMSPHVRAFVIWAPRIFGLILCLFAAMFALDAFDGRPVMEALPGFAIHLIPAAIVGVMVAVAWRFPWVGAVGFTGLAVTYAAMVPRRPDWILIISGPLLLTAVLFALGALGRNGTAHAHSA
jgi:hypothetical protein